MKVTGQDGKWSIEKLERGKVVDVEPEVSRCVLVEGSRDSATGATHALQSRY